MGGKVRKKYQTPVSKLCEVGGQGKGRGENGMKCLISLPPLSHKAPKIC